MGSQLFDSSVTNLVIGSTGSKLTYIIWGFSKQVNLFYLLHMGEWRETALERNERSLAVSAKRFTACQLQVVFLHQPLADILNSASQSSSRVPIFSVLGLLSKGLSYMYNFSSNSQSCELLQNCKAAFHIISWWPPFIHLN